MSTTVKFVQLSPATTTLLHTRLASRGQAGRAALLNTVATFREEPGSVLQLLDELIKDEIPGSGPSGKNVKLLREVRRRLRDRIAGMDAEHSKVQITTEQTGVREELLDIFVELWDYTVSHHGRIVEVADRLSMMVGVESDGTLEPDDVRAWLADQL